MSKSVSKNFMYNAGYQILTLLTPFITTPYLSRVLGADGIGIYSYTTAVVAYFILLAQLGVNTYAQREIAYNQNDPAVFSRIFWEVQFLRIFLVVLSLVFYFVFVCAMDDNVLIYIVQALNILAVLFDISWFFQGLEEFKKIVMRNVVIRILNIALIFILIKEPTDLVKYIALLGVLNVVSGMIIWGYLPQYLVKIGWHDVKPFRNMRMIIELFLPQIAISIYVYLDKTMLGVLTGSPFENGFYEQAEKMVKMPLTVVTSLGVVMLPRISAAFAQRDTAAIVGYMEKSARFTWFLSMPMCFGLIGIASNFVPWFFGPGYDKVVPVMMILSGIVIAISFSNLFGIQYMVPTNRQNLLTLSVTIGAIFNFILNLFIIPQLQSIGAAIATLLTECIVTLGQAWLIRTELPLKIFLFDSVHYVLAGAVMLVFLLFLGNDWGPSILHTIIMIVLGAGIYGIILLLLKDEMVFFALQKIMVKLKR